MFGKIIAYVADVKMEMVNRVSWPSYEDLRGSTTVVIIVTGIFATFIGALDWVLSLVVQWVL